MSTEDEFYLLSHKRGLWSGNLVWWKPNRAGYTARLGEAGVYTAAEAKALTSCTGGDTQPIPVHVALKAAVSVVPGEFLDRIGGVKPPPPPKERFRCGKCGQFMDPPSNPENLCDDCDRDLNAGGPR